MTIPAPIEAHTAIDAVKAVSSLGLGPDHAISNLLVRIADPVVFDPAWRDALSPRRFGGKDSLGNVINTIFPMRMAACAPDRHTLYKRYLKLTDKHGFGPGRWGSYFQRLIAFRSDKSSVNQLERAIQVLNSWDQRSTTAITFHLSASHLDKPRVQGGPCWHFGELLWHANGTVDMVAVYRNHDYFGKALGNFLALGQLLKFICAESNKKPGTLTCHSVHAFASSKQGLAKLAATL